MNKIKRLFKWLAVIVIALVLLDVFLVASFAVFSSQVEKADAIIVMGAAINSSALYNRSIEALNLYEQGYAPVLVLSGGKISKSDISEAVYMQRVIENNDNNNDKNPKMILEEESHNTFENISNSKTKLGDADSVIIVTDKFHLARSVITARAVGFKSVYWHAPKGEYYPRDELVYYYLREIAAMMAYIPKFILK